jgi:Protein kinase domain
MTRLWPSMTDYSGAVQNAEAAFAVPQLAGAEFVTMPPLGMPAVASGQNAVVFQAVGPTGSIAVRCFTTPCAAGRRRYQALERRLAAEPLPAMAHARWLDDAVEIDGTCWPIVTMEWVDGRQLQDWVGANLRDPDSLRLMAREWIRLCRQLRSGAIAHGDLQHGNVLVDAGNRLRLIDFDGVWIPELADAPPTEVGHPNYQHPSRTANGDWGWSVDWFSALVILTSLQAIAADPGIWEHHNGENLIFRESDFGGDAAIWERLGRSSDAHVTAWSRLLREGLSQEPTDPLDLDGIITRGISVTAEPPEFVVETPGTSRTRTTATPPEPPDLRPSTKVSTGWVAADRKAAASKPVQAVWATAASRPAPPPAVGPPVITTPVVDPAGVDLARVVRAVGYVALVIALVLLGVLIGVLAGGSP